MTGALRYEWMRIKTIGSTYWLFGIAVLLDVLITALIVWGLNSGLPDDMNVEEVTSFALTAGGSFVVIPVLVAPFCAVVGVLAIGHEYRYGTNKATLTAVPDRPAVLTAKLVVVAGWVVVTVGTVLLLNFLISALFLNVFDVSGETIRPLFLYLVYCLGFAVAGFAVAAIFRNQTGAMVAVLVWPLVIEPIVNGILSILGQINEGYASLANLLPASAGRRMMFDPYDLFAGFGEFDTWGILPSLLTYLVGIAVLLAAGVTLFIRRDA
jgi:ABC-type transport system involved in multi-copper enzyme maturation permease subunit